MDKNLYNKIMLITFCIIMVLLCAGTYSWFRGRNAGPVIEVPWGKVQTCLRREE